MNLPHQKFVDLAKKLIDKNGREIIIRRIAKTVPDLSKPWEIDDLPPDEFTVKSVFFNFQKDKVDGTLIRSKDVRCLIAQKDLSIEITTDDLIVDGSIIYDVIIVSQEKPGDQSILFDCHLRDTVGSAS